MEKKELRERMGKKAKYVSRQYALNKIMVQWERLAFGRTRR